MDGVYRVTSRVRAGGLLNQRHETQRGDGDISDQKERTLFWPSKRKGGLEQRRRKSNTFMSQKGSQNDRKSCSWEMCPCVCSENIINLHMQLLYDMTGILSSSPCVQTEFT
jgi:hypothetical protein